eukprot:9568273-Alexandrium_andersonii.AAC.1
MLGLAQAGLVPPTGRAPFNGPPRICSGGDRSVLSDGRPGDRGFPGSGPFSDRCLGPHGQRND